MWSLQGWEIRFPNMPAFYGDAEEFYFSELAEGTGCDANWFQGSLQDGARPVFSAPAPALLGNDEAIA
eukprot:3829050-Prymnesium_polylepis.1